MDIVNSGPISVQSPVFGAAPTPINGPGQINTVVVPSTSLAPPTPQMQVLVLTNGRTTVQVLEGGE